MTAGAEYRDPDSYMGDGITHNAGDEICRKCSAVLYRGKDGWACDCDSAMYEYARPPQPDGDLSSSENAAPVPASNKREAGQ